MINLHESIGPDRDRTRNPWICSQTPICSHTRYRLRYAAWQILNLGQWFRRRCSLKDFLPGSLEVLLFGGAEPFMQF